jgi:hypothetical protein
VTRTILLVLAAAVAVVVLNLVLLGEASGERDPVGNLRPPTTTTSVVPTRPTTTTTDDKGRDHRDDD